MVSPSVSHAIPSQLRPQRTSQDAYNDYEARDVPSSDPSEGPFASESLDGFDQTPTPVMSSLSSPSPTILGNSAGPLVISTVTVTGATLPATLAQSAQATPDITIVPLASRTALLTDQVEPVCIGHGLDTQSIGLLSALIIPSVVGLFIWVSGIQIPRTLVIYPIL